MGRSFGYGGDKQIVQNVLIFFEIVSEPQIRGTLIMIPRMQTRT